MLSIITKYVKTAIFDPVSEYIASVGSKGEVSTAITDPTSGDQASVSANKELSVLIQDATTSDTASVGTNNEQNTTIADPTSNVKATVSTSGELSTLLTDASSGDTASVGTQGEVSAAITDSSSGLQADVGTMADATHNLDGQNGLVTASGIYGRVDVDTVTPLQSNANGALSTTIRDSTSGDSVTILPAGQMLQGDFLVEVAKGNVPGHSIINKFGANPDFDSTNDPQDVWSHGGLYNDSSGTIGTGGYLTTARTVVAYQVGGAATGEDDVAGTGARTIQVYGLNQLWAEADEEITMAGTSASTPTTTTFLRIFRVIVKTAGSSGTNINEIDIRPATGTATEQLIVMAGIAPDDGQTQMCIYTVPLSKTAYFLKGYVGIGRGGQTSTGVEFKWRARPNTTADGAWATKGQISCITAGSSWWQYEYGAPAGPLLEKTDIRIEAVESSSSTTLGVVGGFDLLLVDN